MFDDRGHEASLTAHRATPIDFYNAYDTEGNFIDYLNESMAVGAASTGSSCMALRDRPVAKLAAADHRCEAAPLPNAAFQWLGAGT